MESRAQSWFGHLTAIVRNSDASTIRRDLGAALAVALFTVPQTMGYAMIAGLPPAAGIWSAVLASIFGAAFGSSEFLVNGPTNAMCVLLAANAALFASRGDPVAMVVLVTLMISAIQLGAAALKLGKFTRFVSEPVLTGFTAGAGIYIAINQLPLLLGLARADIAPTIAGWTPPAACAFDLVRILSSLASVNPTAATVGISTFLLVRGFQRLEKRIGRGRIPAPFVAVLLVSGVAYLFELSVPGKHALRLVSDIAPLARSLPHLVWPAFSTEDLWALVSPALAIAALGAVEAIAIGKALATKAGHPFDANAQLLGEGAGNMAAALVGGFASSGSFTRTAVNYESGAATRLSAIFSGILVLAIVLVFAPAANHIPIAALAGTLVHVGLKLVNVSRLKAAAQATRADLSVLATTFFAVLLTEHLQYALFAGIAMSIVQALRRAEGFKLVGLELDGRGMLLERPLEETQGSRVVAIDLQGELFFAAADVLETRLVAILNGGTRFMVLRLAQAYNLDFTSADALRNVGRVARKLGGRLVLSGVRPGTLGTLSRAGVIDELGQDAVFALEAEVIGSTLRALDYARELSREAQPLRSVK
jgi:sulfate permease, SulP family